MKSSVPSSMNIFRHFLNMILVPFVSLASGSTKKSWSHLCRKAKMENGIFLAVLRIQHAGLHFLDLHHPLKTKHFTAADSRKKIP